MKLTFEVTFLKPNGAIGKEIVTDFITNQDAESYISITKGVEVLSSTVIPNEI